MSFGRVGRFLRKCGVWLWRMPRRKGYGVHSPYAYSFIRCVILERGEYYAYTTLSLHRECAVWRERDDRLAFRLANFVGAQTGVIVGVLNPVTQSYLVAGCHRTRYVNLPLEAAANAVLLEKVDILVCDFYTAGDASVEDFEDLVRRVSDGAFFCFYGIDRNRRARNCWRKLKELEKVRVTFDLYDIGILCFEQRLARQHYIVRRW